MARIKKDVLHGIVDAAIRMKTPVSFQASMVDEFDVLVIPSDLVEGVESYLKSMGVDVARALTNKSDLDV